MPRPALFLDRDGVINEDPGYTYRVEDFIFLDGIFALTRTALQLGMLPIVVTNQAGIARGYYGEADFEALTAWMCRRFADEGAPLAAVYHCPYHPDGVGPWRRESPDRKPNPGMLFRAREDWDLDLPASVLIGDKDSDLQAGRAAGVGMLLRKGRGPADFSSDSLWEIADYLKETWQVRREVTP